MALTACEVGIWDWDVRTGAVYWSEEVEALFGLTAGTFPGELRRIDPRHISGRSGAGHGKHRLGVCLDQVSVNIRHRVVWPEWHHALAGLDRPDPSRSGGAQATRVLGSFMRRKADDRPV